MEPTILAPSLVCKVMIADAKYSSWYYAHNEKYIKIPVSAYPPLDDINPVTMKLFTKDSVEVFSDGRPPQLVYSPFRHQTLIAGVLLLEKNKTFGRNATKKRLLYKCIPDDKHLPPFLIPYEIKLGFSKHLKNKYVVFKYDHWTDTHPHGTLVEVLGDVDNLDVFYEYQIYCKSLHISLTDFNNTTRDALKRHTNDEYIQMIAQNPTYHIQTIAPTDQYIFTIDPSVSTDFDDALSVTVNAVTGRITVHVFIANVFFWMETLDLWKSFSKRVSTIYLPDRKRPMLPAVLSEALCSLQQGEPRFAFAMSVDIDPVTKSLLPETAIFRNTLIHVNRDYVYEDALLLDNRDYQMLHELTRDLDKGVVDSHDVVSFWMVQMNQMCGEKMAQSRVGVFRAMSYLQTDLLQRVPTGLSDDIRRTISTWNNTTGQYCLVGTPETQVDEDGNYEEVPIEIHHELMKVKSYIHITSPIRRLVDLLNQMWFMTHFGMVTKLGEASSEFLQTWLGQLEYINISMRAIRKVQTDCEVLRKCMKSPEILSSVHRGIVFDKVMKNDGTYTYMVYLEHIRMLSRIHVLDNFQNHSFHQFKMFVFEDEEHIHKKIRLGLCSTPLEDTIQPDVCADAIKNTVYI
jgi:hypothetical protein